MRQQQSQAMVIGRATLRIYLIVSALMFVGGFIGGVALALAGYGLPGVS